MRGRMLRWFPMADKEEKIEFEGEVVESFRSGMYRIQLDNGHETLGYTSGRMRRYRIRINPGDHVKVVFGHPAHCCLALPFEN